MQRSAVGDSTDTLRACETRRRVTGAPETEWLLSRDDRKGFGTGASTLNVEMQTPTAPAFSTP
jgi:hypothetical protein